MVERIADKKFVASIDASQKVSLFTELKRKFGDEAKVVEIVQGVVLITPASIHLNSFMYEPILDMSDSRLKSLYTDVLAMATPTKAAGKGGK